MCPNALTSNRCAQQKKRNENAEVAGKRKETVDCLKEEGERTRAQIKRREWWKKEEEDESKEEEEEEGGEEE